MKIQIGKPRKVVSFEQLKAGDIFKHRDNICMVIENHYSDGDELINAIRLHDGSLDSFYDNTPVEVVAEYDFTIY